MSTLKLAVPAAFLLIAVSAIFLRVRGQRPATRTTVGRYGAPGPHPVGMQTRVIDGKSPLTIWVWYPATAVERRASRTRYPFKIKMGSPVGSPAIAFSKGWAAKDAAAGRPAHPYPLVILSPGFSIGPRAYGWLAEHLASYGFVVVAPDHVEHLDPETQLWRAAVTRPRDVRAVLAYVDAQSAPGGALEGLVDPQQVTVIGHSFGGYTALAAGGARMDTSGFVKHCAVARETADPTAWLCDALEPHLGEMSALAGLEAVPTGLWPGWADPRVDAIVSLAGDAFVFGEAGLNAMTVPVMAIGGTADTDTPFTWGADPTYVHAAGPRKVRVALEGAEHMVFAGPCERVPLLAKLVAGEFCDDSVWNRHDAQALVRHFTTAFLLAELQQDPEAAAALAPERISDRGLSYTAAGY